MILALFWFPMIYAQDRTSYHVANFQKIGTDDAKLDAKYLQEKITGLGIGTCESPPPYKDWTEACEINSKSSCEVIYITVKISEDQRKSLLVWVAEHPKGQKVDDRNISALTCSSRTSLEDCYTYQLDNIARAVEQHDKQCHRGTKCSSE